MFRYDSHLPKVESARVVPNAKQPDAMGTVSSGCGTYCKTAVVSMVIDALLTHFPSDLLIKQANRDF